MSYPPPPPPYGATATPPKSFVTTWLLAWLLGTLGIDRFYLGKTGSAIAKLLTLGGCGVWALIDLIIVLTGNTRDAGGQPLEGYDQNKKTAWIVTGVVWGLGVVSSIFYYAALANAAAGAM